MSMHKLIETKGLRILCIAEIRGNLSLLNDLAENFNADLIIHTGSFGFFDNESISKIHESYLRHIIAFCPLLDSEIVDKVSELSKIDNSNSSSNGINGDYNVDQKDLDLKKYLEGVQLSELMDFINGYKFLKIPVYTIYGMVEDSTVIDKFKLGIYSIPNLFIIDENQTFKVTSPIDGTKIFLCGLGGSLSYQKLFHHGTFNNEINQSYESISNTGGINDEFLPVSGDPGNIWITMVQIGQFIKTVEENYSPQDVRIMITHPSPSREGLLGHLAVITKMDYTISNGLHFLYPSSFNELSICPNFEFYKSKFSEARTQLSNIWTNVSKTVEQIISNNEHLTNLLSIALSNFDKIPVVTTNKNEEIIPISLSNFKRDINSNIIRSQNDSYYIAFQNIWHFNLCDVSVGSILLDVQDGNFQFQANSKGFNFKYRENLTNDQQNLNLKQSSIPSSTSNSNSNSNSTTNIRNSPGNSGFKRGGNRGGRGGYKKY
ncbi:hypothetical protein BN7_258 [Wickerhamomyces ciferrii]|uniref:DUF2433 domain-containing protein n=1 Tax=Wickerhamomyces ciferrii (strain ATCC 14091 / BCRC 22168 / CBS 111 / JCM 3599 / NBRC 0793 / NRRL Y-1031 F-60-10) TaxID=1206466 RepID=K0KH79_WICCF|nr:uncharacterized protein BN7_258 [Wickerhamomyces ciferrii]CCH40724.1 hypothetical protein BN7_258 [Wickerhamomyces ciferrii]